MFRGTGPAVAARNFHDTTASLPGIPSAFSRSESPWADPRRKQTLLSLIDVLSELSHDPTHENSVNQDPSFEDDRDVPTVDEQLQVSGAESFGKFEKRMDCLDKELRNFANAARQLGSSVGILSSAFRLRERLTKVLFLFRENAATLFPRKVQRQARDTLVNPNLMDRRKRSGQRGHQPPLAAKLVIDDDLDPETFPEQFQKFAQDVVTFLNSLNEFPEFTDEAVNTSIRSFEGDLKYWASCLQEYKSQFRFPAVQRYIHDLTSDIGDHIDNITVTLSMFIEIGVPTIRFAQQHAASNLLNLSTVATFFSAVTATTLQFSYAQTGTVLSDAVNAFWFSSLVFSIAAAVNSLLGLTWKQAMYRSPGHRVPWWVLIWIKRSPLVFLVMSVACFSAGLVVFTYSTNQGAVTSTITTVFTTITSFGLAAVSAWFASERWIFIQHRGHVWLEDVITETTNRLLRLRVVVMSRKILHQCTDRVYAIRATLKNIVHGGTHQAKPKEDTDTLPFSNPYMTTVHHEEPGSLYSEPLERSASMAGSDNGTTAHPIHPRERFINAIRSVIMLQAPARPPLRASSTDRTSQMSPIRLTDPAMTGLRGSRVASLVPKLKTLESTQDLPAHQALVRHLQFSPNGKFLATSSWDRTSVIFRVGDPFTTHRLLVHVKGFIGQVAWSPTGHQLLTRLNHSIKIWSEDGVCRKTIARDCIIQSVAWLPGGEAILSVEGSNAVKLDLQGKILDIYHFDRITLHNVAITPDCQRLIGVGPLQKSPSGLQPSKANRVEKRVVVYNIGTKQCENQTPVFNDVRDITIARADLVALISYENKAPPQLWKLELLKDRDARLSLRHTYMPRGPVDFAGPSYFGGKDDQLVLCGGKAGDIHIWDRESAALLHYVRPPALGGDLTCIAWNHATDDPFMFATGSHDGTVRIWSTPHGDAEDDSDFEDRMEGSSNGMIRGRHSFTAPGSQRQALRLDVSQVGREPGPIR
ncbi:WD40 repeat-like protein [Leucogyrophana mollusca]|uniref:WD40 repeat-like protein n=1 Tax=Leucogyrophana mollusca TaxID=85980 RepID=A0ACB8BRA7_9AGAM|nr:WD40 repeat-like protein [Leucogyrophana mollusca]